MTEESRPTTKSTSAKGHAKPASQPRSGVAAASAPAPPSSPPPSPWSLRDLALAGVAAAANIDTGTVAPKERATERGFLARVRAEAEDSGNSWLQTVSNALRQPAAGDAALLALGQSTGLTAFEVLAVALAAAVEADTLVGRALAHVQHPLGSSRPTVGLLAAALEKCLPPGVSATTLLQTGQAARTGLLVLANDSAPLPERPIQVPLPLCLALAGQDSSFVGTTLGLGQVSSVSLPTSVLAEATRRARALGTRPETGLILRSWSDLELRVVAAEISRLLGRRPLFIEDSPPLGLGPLLHLRRLLPVFCCGDRVDRVQTGRIPAIAGFAGPFLVLAAPDSNVGSSSGPLISWAIPMVAEDERRQLWESTLGPNEWIGPMAREHRHGIGRIAVLGHLARHLAARDDRESPSRSDLRAAASALEGTGLGDDVEPDPPIVPDDALALSPALRMQLEPLVGRCRLRENLALPLGSSVAMDYSPGVRALFIGPGGTEQTLAARWLAARLEKPIFRVRLPTRSTDDTGADVRGLERLLAKAEHADVILSFDFTEEFESQAAVLGNSRTETGSAWTARFLRLLGSHGGIVIVTSNVPAKLDPRFARCFDSIVYFDPPSPEDRGGLWRAHLGEFHTLEEADLDRLSSRVDLAGDRLRSVVLAAAAAAHASQRRINLADLLAALDAEYRKLGRPLPEGIRP